MKPAVLILTLSLMTPLLQDYRHVDFDEKTDFSKLKTFSLRDGTINTDAPELNSTLNRKRIADAIRTQLTAKGLSETQIRPDLAVTYELGTINRRGVDTSPGSRRGGPPPQPFQWVEATLVIELTGSDAQPVWRGVYRDDERNPAKFANNLPEDIKKLFSSYPPKKK
jgi:hypothetical protein